MLWFVVACFGRGHELVVMDDGVGLDDGFVSDTGEDLPCLDETGGALITLSGGSAPLDVWVTDDRFIDWIVAGQTDGVPVFQAIDQGEGCMPDWAWHPAPEPAEFVVEPVECTDEPADPDVAPTGPWCPSALYVSGWDDRR